MALATNINANLNNMVQQTQQLQQQPPIVQPINVIPTATVLPSTSVIPGGQVLSTAPLITQISDQQQAPSIITTTNTLPLNANLNPQIINPSTTILNPPNFMSNQIQNQLQTTQQPLNFQQPIMQSHVNFLPNLPTLPTLGKELPVIPVIPNLPPSQFDSFAPTNVRTIRPLRPTLSLGDPLTRKDRRRLPFPSYEEISQATVALGLNNRLSGLSCEKVVSRLY